MDVFVVDLSQSSELLSWEAVDFSSIFIASTHKITGVTRIIIARRIRDARGRVEIKIFRSIRTQLGDISKSIVIEIACEV